MNWSDDSKKQDPAKRKPDELMIFIAYISSDARKTTSRVDLRSAFLQIKNIADAALIQFEGTRTDQKSKAESTKKGEAVQKVQIDSPNLDSEDQLQSMKEKLKELTVAEQTIRKLEQMIIDLTTKLEQNKNTVLELTAAEQTNRALEQKILKLASELEQEKNKHYLLDEDSNRMEEIQQMLIFKSQEIKKLKDLLNRALTRHNRDWRTEQRNEFHS